MPKKKEEKKEKKKKLYCMVQISENSFNLLSSCYIIINIFIDLDLEANGMPLCATILDPKMSNPMQACVASPNSCLGSATDSNADLGDQKG